MPDAPDVPTLFDPAARRMRLDRAAAGWDRGGFLHRHVARGFAERLGDVARAFPDAAVIGSGGGVHAAALLGRFGIARVVQVEAAPGLAALAARAAPAAETVVADDPAALGAGRFDLALSALGLHAENDPVGALVRIRRALRPDGLFLGALVGGRSLHELRAALLAAESEREGGASLRVAPMGDVRDLGGLLQRAGFAMPVADVERLTLDYADPFALMRDCRAAGESNALAARRRRFTRRETLLRAAALYAERWGRPDGRVTATLEIVWLAGWSPGPDQPVPKRPGSATARLADALGAVERPAGEKAGR